MTATISLERLVSKMKYYMLSWMLIYSDSYIASTMPMAAYVTKL